MDTQPAYNAGTVPAGDTHPDLTAYFAQEDKSAAAAPATASEPASQPATDTKPDEPDTKSVDRLLDAWEKGQSATADKKPDPYAGTPFEGLAPDHPVVKWAQSQMADAEWNKQAADFARNLVSSGVPQQFIPELMNFIGQVRGVVARNQQLEGLLQQVDKSDMVKTTQAQRTADKYKAYGVTAEDLLRANPQSAEDMENFARYIAIHNRANKVQSRADSGADRFESSTGRGSGTNDILDMTKPGIDLIRRGLK